MLAYRRRHPRSAPLLSLTNFADDSQSVDAGMVAAAGLCQPGARALDGRPAGPRRGRLELPPWGFAWLTGT